ncbi:MAG: hypothetical protein PQJ60_10730 [Spirochaetales bacterium]|nr:hypothetical protein [Spirochaetales bacterium]
MKLATGQKMNRKEVIGVYLAQCGYFGQCPIDAHLLRRMTAREIYKRGESLFLQQPKEKQQGFALYLKSGGRVVTKKLTFWEKVVGEVKRAVKS